MRLACIAFTEEGLKIAEIMRQSFEVDIYDKYNYKEQLDNIFSNYKGIVFISSTGIAVRLCAPYINHKTVDPAVIVIDDLGRYCISLLSGHLGGANQLTQELAGKLNCQAIITTASDGRNIDAIDMFAKKNQLYIESMEDAKKITAMMLEDKKIKVESECKVGLRYHNLVDEDYDGVVFLTSRNTLTSEKPYVVLRPKNLNIGLGCRRGKTRDEIIQAIQEVFTENNLSIKSIKSIATVDVKKDEQGIHEACQYFGCSIQIYGREEISRVQENFSASDFVKSSIGVSAVCEPCAYLAGGEIIVSKTAKNGITIAVAKES